MKMKLFALAVSLLLVLSAAPAFSYTPPPPTPPSPIDSIEPQELNLTGPCCKSQPVVLEDVIWYVKDLWAWDIKISWDTAYINITTWTLHVPAGWPADGYVVLFNDLYNAGGGRFGLHFAVTGLAGKATNFTGTMSLVTMNFAVLYEPKWHIGIMTTYITIDFKEMSTGCGAPIEFGEGAIEDGHIHFIPSKPNIEVLFSKDPTKFNLTEKAAQGYKELQVITAYVWVSNAEGLYDIGVHIQWDSDLLDIELQQITINKDWFPMPWTSLYQCLSDGNFYFEIDRPAPPTKPGIKGTNWILKMEFKAKCFVDEHDVPINGSTLITPHRCEGTFLTMCGHTYNDEDELTLSDAKYYWTPIPHDFSQDGHVGKEDIGLILDHYGEEGDTISWDLNDDEIVDIYDIVIVAKDYCKDKPPVLAKDPPYVP